MTTRLTTELKDIDRVKMVNALVQGLNAMGIPHTIDKTREDVCIVTVTDKNGVHPIRFTDNSLRLSNDYYGAETSTVVDYKKMSRVLIQSSFMSHRSTTVFVRMDGLQLCFGFTDDLRG